MDPPARERWKPALETRHVFVNGQDMIEVRCVANGEVCRLMAGDTYVFRFAAVGAPVALEPARMEQETPKEKP